MTDKQIAQELKDKGFDVRQDSTGVIASLFRAINIFEIFSALDGKVEQEHMSQENGKVKIIGRL